MTVTFLLLLEVFLFGMTLLFFEFLFELFFKFLISFVFFRDHIVLGFGYYFFGELIVLKILNSGCDLIRPLNSIIDLALLIQILLHLIMLAQFLQFLVRRLACQDVLSFLFIILLLNISCLLLIVVNYALGSPCDNFELLVIFVLCRFLVELIQLSFLFFAHLVGGNREAISWILDTMWFH